MGQTLPTARIPREVDLKLERGPNLEDVDYDDIRGRILAKDQAYRDRLIEQEKIKLVRVAAKECYKQYHVNHAYKCRPIYIEYMNMIRKFNFNTREFPLTIDGKSVDELADAE